MTPHIACEPQDLASTLIMPGDPKRSQRIAREYLADAKLVNDVRGVQGYTGKFNGHSVSVMASGMGGPSMGIYSHELFAFLGVKTIIRVGTMGALDPNLKLGDVVLAQAASYNSNFMSQFRMNGTFSPIADFELLMQAFKNAESMNIPCIVGNILTSDYFYNFSNDTADWAKVGVLGVEMETAILYANAAIHKRRALSILTVSDSVNCEEMLTPEERENNLDKAIRLALSLS